MTSSRFRPSPPLRDWPQITRSRGLRPGRPDGHWLGTGMESDPVLATSFALLFLKSGDGVHAAAADAASQQNDPTEQPGA